MVTDKVIQFCLEHARNCKKDSQTYLDIIKLIMEYNILKEKGYSYISYNPIIGNKDISTQYYKCDNCDSGITCSSDQHTNGIIDYGSN